MEWVVFNIITLFCVLVFVAVGIWALLRKTPMHFWAGTTVDPETITDIKKYNKANAIMWFGYCVPMILSMFIAPFHQGAAGIVLGVGCVAGFPVLIVAYVGIKRKYTKV